MSLTPFTLTPDVHVEKQSMFLNRPQNREAKETYASPLKAGQPFTCAGRQTDMGRRYRLTD